MDPFEVRRTSYNKQQLTLEVVTFSTIQLELQKMK